MESDQTNNTTTTNLNLANNECVAAPATANVVTIPIPIVNTEGTYVYVTVKGSLHDNSCSVFGLDDTEIQALSKRFVGCVKPAVNGIMILKSPLVVVNSLAKLSYKVVCSCGEADICWTMEREIFEKNKNLKN